MEQNYATVTVCIRTSWSTKSKEASVPKNPTRSVQPFRYNSWLVTNIQLSAIISWELHVRSSPIFYACYLWPSLRPSRSGVVICYVFPVLWMTSYLHISWSCSTSPPGWGSEAHTYAALGLARRNTRCRQPTLGTTSCTQSLLGCSGRVEYLWHLVCT